jgi:hypothetical protein
VVACPSTGVVEQIAQPFQHIFAVPLKDGPLRNATDNVEVHVWVETADDFDKREDVVVQDQTLPGRSATCQAGAPQLPLQNELPAAFLAQSFDIDLQHVGKYNKAT